MTHYRSGLPLLLTGLLLLGLVACQRQGQQSQRAAVDTSAIQSKLDSLGRLVSQANRTGDAELFASTWAKDRIMSGAGQSVVRGRDSIVAAFKRRPPLPPGAEMTIHPIEMRVLSGQWAYAFGVDSLTYTSDGAGEPVTETSTFLVLIHKTAEGWKTYREVLSANSGPPGAQ